MSLCLDSPIGSPAPFPVQGRHERSPPPLALPLTKAACFFCSRIQLLKSVQALQGGFFCFFDGCSSAGAGKLKGKAGGGRLGPGVGAAILGRAQSMVGHEQPPPPPELDQPRAG